MAEKKNFARLLDRMTPESRAFIEEKAHQLNAEMDLAELRRARRLSQEQLAQVLHVQQASVAKMEKRTDMYISSMRRFIEAMGGELVITAKFADHSVRITQFGDLGPAEAG